MSRAWHLWCCCCCCFFLISCSSGVHSLKKKEKPAKGKPFFKRTDDDDDIRKAAYDAVRSHGKNSTMYDVVDVIFDGYKHFLRPALVASQPTAVSVTVHVVSILQVDEKTQNLVQDLYLTLSWLDPHLAWNASQFADSHGNHLDHLVLPQESVWRPDVVITPLTGRMEDMGYDKLPLRVESSGHVIWQPGGVFTTKCHVDITYFPFDRQRCTMRIMAWGSRKEDMELRLSANPVDQSFFSRNAEWELKALEPVEEDVVEKEARYSAITVVYRLRRRPLFPAMTIVVPILLLSVMSTLVFALPAESGEKMSLAVTMFLALILSLSLLLTQLPNSSLHVSLYVCYLVLLSFLSALSILLSLIVMRLHYRGSGPATQPWSAGPRGTLPDTAPADSDSTIRSSPRDRGATDGRTQGPAPTVDDFWVAFVLKVRRYRRMTLTSGKVLGSRTTAGPPRSSPKHPPKKVVTETFSSRDWAPADSTRDGTPHMLLSLRQKDEDCRQAVVGMSGACSPELRPEVLHSLLPRATLQTCLKLPNRSHNPDAAFSKDADGKSGVAMMFAAKSGEGKEREEEEQEKVEADVVWEEVALSLDYVLFRLSLSVVIVATIPCLVLFGYDQYTDTENEWGFR